MGPRNNYRVTLVKDWLPVIAVGGRHVRLLAHRSQSVRNLECVVDLDAEVANGALELRMAEEQLHGPPVLRPPVDQCGLRRGCPDPICQCSPCELGDFELYRGSSR